MQLIDKNLEYSGGIANGLKDGKGFHYDKKANLFYSGNFQKGKRHGFGMIWFGSPGKRIFNYVKIEDAANYETDRDFT